MTAESDSQRFGARFLDILRAIDPRDVAGIAGIGLVTAGAWEIYHPAGLIVLGSALLTFAILAARKG